MTKRFMQLAASLLAMILCLPPTLAANSNSGGDTMIRVGLASSSDHNDTGELACAHLQNNTGYGSGFRFGYYDANLNFIELGRTSKSISEVAVLKTQNMYYGYDSTTGKNTYSDSISSNIAVGCYHIQIPGSYTAYEDAAADAAIYGGFVAWVNGAYQVRVGAYQSKSGAEGALATMPQGTIVGTSSYGISVVQTGTDHILFQFDNGSSQPFGILPDVTGASDVRTWFLGFKYRGGFSYQRISGNNLTVVNVLSLENYIKGVVCYEMGREWPLEALKTQATCARTYVLKRLGYHGSLGFDVCNSDSCQVYRGAGSNRTDYGPSTISDQAVQETSGQVIWYQSNLADTYYSSSNGGASESAYNVWGTDITKYPYLCGIIDPYEPTIASLNSYSSWTVKYTSAELTSRLQSYGYGTSTSVDRLELTYSELGNVIQVKICYANGQSNTITPRTKPRAIRALFGVNSIRFIINGLTVNAGSTSSGSGYAVNGSGSLSGLDGLYTISGTGTTAQIGSAPYIIAGTGNTSALGKTSSTTSGTNEGGGTLTVTGSSYVFQGSGWGHQIGMSQYGANAMARLGYTYDEICEFYFPGTEVGAYH